MNPTALVSLATANPPLSLTQREAFEWLDGHADLEAGERDLYRRLLLEGPVRSRSFGMDSTGEALETDPDRLNERFLRHARATAGRAMRRALRSAGLAPGEIGTLVVNTCTGRLCPGLSSYLAEDVGLSTELRVVDLAGMGCGAALPNLETASGLLALDGGRPALCVAVEICSATLFFGPDPGLVVSNAIFGDGAAAVVLRSGTNPGARPPTAWLRGFFSVLDPAHRELLRYRQEGGRLRNQLSVRVPVVGARLAMRALDGLCAARGLDRSRIRWWAVHAGGTAVLDQVERTLALDPAALRYSREVFQERGNMSSPTVLFALEKILDDARPAAGDLGVLLAFGAGFSACAGLLEFTGER